MIENKQPSKEELIYRIALKFIPKIGNIQALELVQYFGSAKAVFAQKTLEELRACSATTDSTATAILDQNTLARAEEEWAFCQKYGIGILAQDSLDYPKRLKNCYDAPFLLFFKGKANLNSPKIVAIVGTRKPTEEGRMFCEQLVKDLGLFNVMIISGLAYGIDITAHKQCISSSMANIAVVAHGLSTIYPQKHKKTAQKIVENGGILTEFMSGAKPLGKHFPMRNRIIAGMADVVVVVETAEKGGSMITAQLANGYNKDVFAVPGRVNDPYSKGCNHLIKSHRASLLESAADIAYIMRWEQQKAGVQKKLFVDLSSEERSIVDLLVGEGETHLDTIITQTQISTSRIAAALLELEFKGMIRALPGKNFRLV